MRINIIDILPSQKPFQCNYNDCTMCNHLKNITLNSLHKIYIECDLNEEK